MTRQHSALCLDEDGVLDGCVCGLDDRPVAEPLEGQMDLAELWFGDRYRDYDPDDREPMAGDPYWREDA